jgi:hypothetical protein
MVIAIPAAIGLFSALHEAPKHKTKCGHRVCFNGHMHALLEEFCWLARNVSTWPTKIAEIIDYALLPTRGAFDDYKRCMDGIVAYPAAQNNTGLFGVT